MMKKKVSEKLADDSICSANVESKKIIQDASNEAASILSKAKDKAQKELEQAQNLRNQVIKFKNDIISAYKEHLSLITNLPEPVFMNLEEDEDNTANDLDLDLSNEFSNTHKISEDLFSSEDLEQKYSSLQFGKNYDINQQ